jgi:uncharacterized protein Yka (UPF0111/DUF47 family)
MVFPIESEDRTMRNLLMLCQDYVRLIVEAYRKILAITDNFLSQGTKKGEFVDDVQKLVDQAADINSTLINELHNIGGVLLSRDDFLRLTSNFGNLMDQIKKIGARITEMDNRGWVLDQEVIKNVSLLNDEAFNSLIKLRGAVMSLGFNSEKSVGFTREIYDLEKNFDQKYLQAEVSVITSKHNIPIILLLKDTISLIESLIHKVKDTSDLIRIIAL